MRNVWPSRSFSWRWIAAIVVFSAAIATASLFYLQSGQPARGYTFWGYVLGILALVASVVAIAYPLRKRWFQELLRIVPGRMQDWLWLHMTVGISALVLAGFHSGWNLKLSWGSVSFVVLIFLVLGGIYGRWRYQTVARKVPELVGNLSLADTQENLADNELELETLSAGRSRAFKNSVLEILDLQAGNKFEWEALIAQLVEDEQARAEELVQLGQERAELLERYKLQRKIKWQLGGWRLLHLPLTLLFPIAIGLHLFAVFFPYGTRIK